MTKNINTCTKILRWCSGHRVYGHEGGCANLHGHNYRAEIQCHAEALDQVGRIVDFGHIKDVVGSWIDSQWDHGFIVYEKDADMMALFTGSTWKYWVSVLNPTAENLANILLARAQDMLDPFDITVLSVRIWETETCYGTAIRRE